MPPPCYETAGAYLAFGQIKANQKSGIYHVPGGAFYVNTKARVSCFDSEGEAAAAGFRKARRQGAALELGLVA